MTKPRSKASRTAKKNALFPALFAVGGSMAAGSAAALELGDIEVESSLGQPLRASIAFALGPNEELQNYCVSVSGAASSSGLPTISGARVVIGDGRIMLTSRQAIREPMVSTRLTVNCPYTPNITREYTMFLSPPGLLANAAAANVQQQAPSAPPVVTPRPQPARPAAAAAPPAPAIPQGTSYRVQPGESLSEIAQRIENRQIRLWPAVNALFEANPSAFIGADPNRLKAGSILTIPTFVGDEVGSFAATTSAPTGSTPGVAETVATPDAGAVSEASTVDAAADAALVPVSESFADDRSATVTTDAIEAPAEKASTDQPAANTAPTSAVQESAEGTQSIVIPDTAIDDPIPAASTPNRSVARIQPAAVPVEPGTNWSLWIAGGGALLIAGLLLFGRRLRDQFGSTPIGSPSEVAAVPARRATDQTETLTAPELPVVQAIDDDSPTDQNLALDASLGLGHDLDGGVDVDFSENGGMDGTTKLDIELPAAEEDETDVISPPHIDTSNILESEVLPEDDDYDMSVIMDMTKMPRPEDVTEKDLKAIEVSNLDENEDGSYTMNDEVDYDILEQDYQDELSATQALNLEIEKAAQELTKRLEDDDTSSTGIQIAAVEELDITAEMPAKNDETLSDLDDTNVNEALQLPEDDTEKMFTEEKTEELPSASSDTATVEMPQRFEAASDDGLDAITSDGDHTVEIITRDDDTVEMEVEGGRVNTKNR
ncbi:MAG: LysM peptidoglycan-binding domain-containing protein [Woeseiaceae bacterium]|nr:LysM peptidoglycan-binding domain-containing protein [Woeseiaceae bacterium]